MDDVEVLYGTARWMARSTQQTLCILLFGRLNGDVTSGTASLVRRDEFDDAEYGTVVKWNSIHFTLRFRILNI